MAWPDSDYPGGYDAPPGPDATLDGTPLHSELHEFELDAIQKMQAELGLTPSGAYSTVAAAVTAFAGVLPTHGCVLTDAAQSFANTSVTTVTWGTEALDTHAYHVASSDTITFPATGFYVVSARLVRASGNWTTGYLRIVLSSGGAHTFPGTGNGEMTGTMLVYVSASTTFTVTGYHASGGAVNVDSTLYVAKLPFL